MLKLTEIRHWAKTLFALELIVAFAVLLSGLAVCPFAFGSYGMPGLLTGLAASGVASVAVFAFLIWVGRDAQRSLPVTHLEHVRKAPEPDGNMTEVASAPVLPPWMGTGAE